IACQAEIKCSLPAHDATARTRPGRRRTVRTRLVVGSPGEKAANTLRGTGPDPPPADGRQPRCGRKLGAFGAFPVYVPRNNAERAVVTPGLTGLPSLPRKSMSIARSVSCIQPTDHVTARA